jgi:hypothetical protein
MTTKNLILVLAVTGLSALLIWGLPRLCQPTSEGRSGEVSHAIEATDTAGKRLRSSILLALEKMRKKHEFVVDVSPILSVYLKVGDTIEEANNILAAAHLAPLQKASCEANSDICSELWFESETTLIQGFSARASLTIGVGVELSKGIQSVKAVRAHLDDRYL